MRVKKFVAGSVSACMDQVKAELGERALIVHKREYHKPVLFGLFRRRVAEIVAAVDLDTDQQQRVEALVALGRQRTGFTGNLPPVRVDARQEAIVPPPLRDNDVPQQPARAPNPAGESAPTPSEPSTIERELRELRTMLHNLSVRFAAAEQRPVFGEPYDTIHRRLISECVDRGVANRFAAELSERTLPADAAAQEQAVLEALAEWLPASGAIQVPLSSGRCKVVVLVGPTGMGKTTTLAKIAAEIIAGRGLSVRFITTDTYRMAAMEQLQRYVDIMGSTLSVVYSVEDMAAAIEAATGADLVLIDTAGCSQYNRTQIADLCALLEKIPEIDVHLVLAAGGRLADMVETVERFRVLPLSHLLLTKLDETARYGPILGLVRRVRLPVSYLTVGQNVPEDIEVATSRGLAELVYGCRRFAETAPMGEHARPQEPLDTSETDEPPRPDGQPEDDSFHG